MNTQVRGRRMRCRNLSITCEQEEMAGKLSKHHELCRSTLHRRSNELQRGAPVEYVCRVCSLAGALAGMGDRGGAARSAKVCALFAYGLSPENMNIFESLAYEKRTTDSCSARREQSKNVPLASGLRSRPECSSACISRLEPQPEPFRLRYRSARIRRGARISKDR